MKKLFIFVALALALTGCTSPEKPSGVPAVSCEYPEAGNPAKPVDPPPADNVAHSGTVSYTLAFANGDVEMTLDRAKAPCTVNSFAALASQGYFDKTACHRLVDKGIFVLQCGDPSGTGRGGPGYTFADETNQSDTYPAGTIAMANAGPNTNGSQFFLVYSDSQLPPDYTVFGTIDDKSLDVIAEIASQGQDGAYGDSGRPIADATIKSVTAG